MAGAGTTWSWAALLTATNCWGTLPSFEIAGDDDSGDKGRVIPSLSINQCGALLGEWLGISDSDISEYIS